MLKSNLERLGVDLAVETDLLYLDVTNNRIGINESTPTKSLQVDNVTIEGSQIRSTSGALDLGANSDISITGGSNGQLLSTDGSGNLSWITVDTEVTGRDVLLTYPDDSTLTDGIIADWTESTNVSTAIDDVNECMLNIMNNTAVANVDFSASPLSGGAGTSVTLTITADGNPNRYDITWGDGDTTTGTADSTPSHTYATNSGSPFSVVVRAYNNSGSGTCSESSKTRTNYVIIYTADPVVSFDLYRVSSGGSALSGNDLYVIEGNSLYMDNNTTNIGVADVTYTMAWGDGSSDDSIANDSADGGTAGSRLAHTWGVGTSSGTSRDTLTLTLDTHSTADPASIPTNGTETLKVYAASPSAPDGLSTKTISFSGSVGTNPKLASGFTDNTSATTSYTAGDDVNRTTATTGTIESTAISTYAYNAASGDLSAYVNGSANGARTMTSGDDTGTYTSLVITDESDYNLLTSGGASTTFAASTYYPGAYSGFKAKVAATASGISVGANNFQLQHSATGDTNIVDFIKDDLTASPTTNVGSATLAEGTAGTKRYISGIPYYNTGSPNLTLSGVTIDDLVGQCYTNQANIVEVDDGTNQEGTVNNAITNTDYTYANIDGASSMLTGGIPNVNTGTSSAYAIGSLTVPITSSSVRTISRIKARARNVNGVGSYSSDIATNIQVHTAAQSGISEIAIAVSDALGATYDDDGVRVFDFNAATTDTPSFSGATNFYTNSPYTESSDPGVSGTKEATIRLGVLKYDVTDYSSGYLPVGPDRSSDTGTQYFTMAFRRTTVANFDINITSSSGISGLWIAAPGTAIDSASSINGWLDASTAYAGSGVPGANTGSGGNGSNGCAFTTGDRIQSSTSLSGSYTMTLGTENMTNATGNVVLVRIALQSGESVTALSIT